MMAFAPPKSIDGSKMQTKMSTWTPLNHRLLNDQVFEERRALLGKWFDKWTDSQRRRILTGLLERCSLSQQKFCCRKLQEKIPAEALDFTTKLPRVLSVYIFSFLDPRSLCRCAQVSWYWKSLAELDQLWMLKCLRFNWYISFSPTPFEQGVWKKHYIQMVKELHITKPKTPPKDGFIVADVQPIPGSSQEEKQSPSLALRSSSSLRKKNNPGEKELPPWRSSDKHPTDIIRFNYLDNCDPEHFWPGGRKRKEVTPDIKRQLRDKKNKLEDRARLRKAQSLMSLSSHPKVPVRLAWPLHLPVGPSDPEAVTRILMEHFPNHPGLRSPPSEAPESTQT
ncbi:F-box only protein 16 [Cricetulus griseus]|uniref:F-box only protein 16 n=1 Tax=Cricetulus griseus TaxID=10029 RepID=A0A9J7HCE4_CRIGR|nr:F-box only protein 16 [Cricetulus griseus]XP_035308996.1 F-box only protein 16 [Cricetulus griseus]